MGITKNNKSTRHSKIAGDFGEHLVMYWLSKSEFECARVDHIGIDLIAGRRDRKEDLMGISVKSRTRVEGKEKDNVLLKKGDFGNMDKACEAFRCVPYFALVIDAGSVIQVFIISKQYLLEKFPATASGGSSWRMTQKCLNAYRDDPQIKMFELELKKLGNWWPSQSDALPASKKS